MGKEKKEIGKLLELLNEYEKEVKKSEFYEWEKGIGGDTNLFRRDTRDEEGSHIYSDTADTYVISKKYGFIGWLVENDKIDFYTILKESGTFRKEFYAIENRKEYERLIMLLSISDTPIEDLCGYLKDDSNITKGETKIGTENQDTQELDMTTTHIEGKVFLA